MGIVTDEAKAINSICYCQVYNGRKICWSKGVVGTLTEEQQRQFCTAETTVSLPDVINPSVLVHMLITGELRGKLNKGEWVV